MKKQIHTIIFIFGIAAVLLLPGNAFASMQSAIAHGVESIDYRKARSVWAQTRHQLSCKGEDQLLAESRRGFIEDEFYLTTDMEVIVTFIYDGARARNTLGWYDAATPDNKRIIWRDASTGPNAPLEQGSKASLGILPMGTDLRFFISVDGAREGSLQLFQDNTLNPSAATQVAARLFDGQSNKPLVLGFEDRANCGDEDFNDLVIQIEYIPVNGPAVYRVNSETGTANLIDTLSVSGAYASLISDPVTGELLLMKESGNRLIQVNPFTTAVTSQTMTNMAGKKIDRIAHSQDFNSLYAYDRLENEILEMSFATGYTRNVAYLPVDQALGDLLFDQVNNRLLFTAITTANQNALYAIDDPTNASIITQLASLSYDFTGLAWSPENALLGKDTTSDNIYTIDASTGTATLLGTTTHEIYWADLASTYQFIEGVNSVAPEQLYSSGAEVITQHDNVIAGQLGIHSDRYGNGLATVLTEYNMSGAAYEQFHELFYIPEDATTLEFEVLKDYGSFKYHFGFFDYAVVDGLIPNSLEWRVTAAENAIPVFDDRDVNPGATLTLDVQALGLRGKTICFMIVPNNRFSVFLRNPWRYTPKGNGNNTKRQPLFSASAANPGMLDQAMAFSNEATTIFSFEDLTRYEDSGENGWTSDNSFDDLTFSVTPRLLAVGTPNEVFMLKPAADDIRNRQTTAEVQVDWDYIDSQLNNLEPVDLQTNTLLTDAYMTVTYLSGNLQSTSAIGFADPDRPYEWVSLFEDTSIAAQEADENGRGPSIGTGLFPTGAYLRFSVKNDNGKYFTDPSLNSSSQIIHTAGRIPNTDTVIIKLKDSPDSPNEYDHLIAVTFEEWDLQHSGDVRILTQDSDGVPYRENRCY